MFKIFSNIERVMGFVVMITILFVVFKLLDEIDLSWWWILSPLWIILLIFAIVFILWFIIIKYKINN